MQIPNALFLVVLDHSDNNSNGSGNFTFLLNLYITLWHGSYHFQLGDGGTMTFSDVPKITHGQSLL